MNQLYILLLALWPAINSSDAWDPDEHATAAPWLTPVSESHHPGFYETFFTDEETSGYENNLESEDSTDAWDPDEHTTADPWQRSMSESHHPGFYGMFYTDEETLYENYRESEERTHHEEDPAEELLAPSTTSLHTIQLPLRAHSTVQGTELTPSAERTHHEEDPAEEWLAPSTTSLHTIQPPLRAHSPVQGPELPPSADVPEPNITVYRQMEDREHVMVLCKFAKIVTHSGQSFKLSVESELNYTIEPQQFSPLHSSEMRVYMVTVSPPASFTCVHEIGFNLNVSNLRSQTYNYNYNYNYSGSVSDHREEGASSLYICFSSFIAVGLFIMTAAVIVTNIRRKTKDTNSTAVTDNDYVEA